VEHLSKPGELKPKDWKKILTGAGIAIGGAALTYVAETVPNIDFGVWTPVAVAVASVLVNFGRKWLTTQA